MAMSEEVETLPRRLVRHVVSSVPTQSPIPAVLAARLSGLFQAPIFSWRVKCATDKMFRDHLIKIGREMDIPQVTQVKPKEASVRIAALLVRLPVPWILLLDPIEAVDPLQIDALFGHEDENPVYSTGVLMAIYRDMTFVTKYFWVNHTLNRLDEVRDSPSTVFCGRWHGLAESTYNLGTDDKFWV